MFVLPIRKRRKTQKNEKRRSVRKCIEREKQPRLHLRRGYTDRDRSGCKMHKDTEILQDKIKWLETKKNQLERKIKILKEKTTQKTS